MPLKVSHNIGITTADKPSYLPVIPNSKQERMIEQVKIGLYLPAMVGVICVPYKPIGISPPACIISSGTKIGKYPTTFFPVSI